MDYARFQPALMVLALFACAGVLSLPAWGEGLGVGSDRSFLLALVHAELALAPLLFSLPISSGRRELAAHAVWLLACALAVSAALLCFSFVAGPGPVLHTRGLALACWIVAGGVAALGTALEGRFGGPWRARLRIVWIALTALPVLWHYFALEYAQKSLLHLRPLSPNWLLAAYPDAAWASFEYWPLLVVGGFTWTAGLLLARREAGL